MPCENGPNEALTAGAMKYLSSFNFVWQRTRRARKNLRICAKEGNHDKLGENFFAR